jgi:hypothetical protein
MCQFIAFATSSCQLDAFAVLFLYFPPSIRHSIKS